DGFLLLFASVLNPFLAFMVGGVGSALADITGGYGMYALFTLLIKGMEAVLVSWLVCRGRSSFRYVAYILGGLLMVGGYFLADAYINQSWQLSLTGIPGNLVQAAAGYAIALAAYPLLQKRMHRHPDMHHKTV
ncbi:MAG: ECF transporter S component, partial [Clostridium sp.]